MTTTSTTTGEANMFPIVDSANESAADIPGSATVEIATEAVADITAYESHSISTVTAADGVAGTLKRLATKASLQHPDLKGIPEESANSSVACVTIFIICVVCMYS